MHAHCTRIKLQIPRTVHTELFYWLVCMCFYFSMAVYHLYYWINFPVDFINEWIMLMVVWDTYCTATQIDGIDETALYALCHN